jgi:hypothetical protein
MARFPANLNMNPAFRTHGLFSTRVEGRLIISDVTGPWNKELVEEWAQDAYPIARMVMTGGPHAAIAVMHNSMVCSADAMASLKLAVQFSVKKLNCVAHIIVADSTVDGRALLESTFARIYEGICPHRLFDNLDDARAWGQQLVDEAIVRQA